jgi:hypothetical protein
MECEGTRGSRKNNGSELTCSVLASLVSGRPEIRESRRTS